MNIIEAWKTAKEGENITRKDDMKYASAVIKKGNGCHDDRLDFSIKMMSLNVVGLMADDWEVVNEKNKHSQTHHMKHGGTLFTSLDYGFSTAMCFYSINIPIGAKVTIEWEE